jgi:hypothetical protein
LKIIDKYISEYESKHVNEQITFGKQNGNLYVQAPDNQKVTIYPPTESPFYGTNEELSETQVIFTMDTQRNVKHYVLRIGFMSLQFEKTS